MEKSSFEGQISPEGEKAPFRRALEDQSKKIEALKLKTDAARLAALIAKKSGDGIFKN